MIFRRGIGILPMIFRRGIGGSPMIFIPSAGSRCHIVERKIILRPNHFKIVQHPNYLLNIIGRVPDIVIGEHNLVGPGDANTGLDAVNLVVKESELPINRFVAAEWRPDVVMAREYIGW